MFDRVTIRVSELDASRRFYETLLGPARGDEWDDFSISSGGTPVTRGLHVAFVARSREEVDAFWRRGIDAGYESDGEPGPRRQYGDEYYGGFLLDPDGNSVESVFHGRQREGDNRIDHLWIRVADLDAQKRFWRTVAPVLGLRIANELAERFHVAARDRSFALVHDGRSVTQNVYLAFPVPDDATVAAFHASGVVLDPDGNTVEAVNRNPRR